MINLSVRLLILCYAFAPCAFGQSGLDELDHWYGLREMQYYFLAEHEKSPELLTLKFTDKSMLLLAKSRFINLSPVFKALCDDLITLDDKPIKLSMSRHAFILMSYYHYAEDHLFKPDMWRFLRQLSDSARYEIAEMVNGFDGITSRALIDMGIIPFDEIEFELNAVYHAFLNGNFGDDEKLFHVNILKYLANCDSNQRKILVEKIKVKNLEKIIPILISSEDKDCFIYEEVARKLAIHLRTLHKFSKDKLQYFEDRSFFDHVLKPIMERLKIDKIQLYKLLEKKIEHLFRYVYPGCIVEITDERIFLSGHI
jgi:hypothetical protein